MAGYANPLRGYKFRVEIDGVDQWLIQKFKAPEIEVSQIEHGGSDANIKTPSKKKIGNATIEKLKPLDKADLWSFEWMNECLLGFPSATKRNIVVVELANDGVTTVNRHILVGCFPIKSSQTDWDRMADANTIETVELSVEDYIKMQKHTLCRGVKTPTLLIINGRENGFIKKKN